jgi:hypothetical protein
MVKVVNFSYVYFTTIKKFAGVKAGCWWFTPVILATCEAEITRLDV